MTLRIEDYAIVGDTETVALVGNNGSIDWLCLPRFDSAACFAALLGDETNGCWRIAPVGDARRVERRYRPGTLVLETEFETAEGTVRVLDCMPPREGQPDVIRIVQGMRGRVPMRLQLTPRFDYGRRIPLINPVPGGVVALAGPEALYLTASVDLDVADGSISAAFAISEGEEAWFRLGWFPSHEGAPEHGRCRRGSIQDRSLVARMVGSLHLPGAAPRDRPALADHVEGAHLCANRRHRGRGHHVPARGDRRRAELGLPVLLAA